MFNTFRISFFYRIDCKITSIMTDVNIDEIAEKVFAKIVDLAKEKNIFNGQNSDNSTSEDELKSIEVQDSEFSIVSSDNNEFKLDKFYSSNQVDLLIHKHTCLVCFKNFENSRQTFKHFLTVHLIQKPTYKCENCSSIIGTVYFDLDQYFKHLIEKHLVFNPNIDNMNLFIIHLFDIFILKTAQDLIAQYFLFGKYFLDSRLVDKLNKLRFGKENTTFYEKITLRIYENLFQEAQNSCLLGLKTNSIKSNLLFNQFNQAEILNDLKTCLNIDIDTIQHFATTKFFQCKLCLKLFVNLLDAQHHFAQFHTFNKALNQMISCPYCGELLKSNDSSNLNILSLLNSHILDSDDQSNKKRGCLGLRTKSMNIFNAFQSLVENEINEEDHSNQKAVEMADIDDKNTKVHNSN
jgi:hypothetical protein